MPILKSTFLLLVAFLTSGCSQADISIDPFITNDASEIRFLEAKTDSAQLSLFLSDLNRRYAKGFDWNRWWSFLSMEKFDIATLSGSSRGLVYSLGLYACASESSDWIVYKNFLKHQSLDSARSEDRPLRQISHCRSSLAKSEALALLADLERDDPVDFKMVRYIFRFLDTSDLNSLNSDFWIRALNSLPAASNDVQFEDSKAFIQDALSRPLIREQVVSLVTASPAIRPAMLRQLPATIQFAIQRSGINSILESKRALEWWKSTSKLLIEALKNGELGLQEALGFQTEVVERYRPNAHTQLEDWLDTFDLNVNDLLTTVKNHLKVNHEILSTWLSTLDSRSTPIDLWFASLLEGFPRVEVQQSKFTPGSNPLLFWIRNRVWIRSAMNKIVPSSPKMRWWGTREVCPIPLLSDTPRITREWKVLQTIPDEISRGCYRFENDSSQRPVMIKALSLTYDTILLAPSVSIDADETSKGIIDLSGEPQDIFDFKLSRQDALAFPVLVLANDLDGSVKWFIFHFIGQTAGPTRLGISVPPRASNGGSFNMQKAPTLPLWLINRGAPPTPGHEKMEGGRGDQSLCFDERINLFSDPMTVLSLKMADLYPQAQFIQSKFSRDGLSLDQFRSLVPATISLAPETLLRDFLAYTLPDQKENVSKLDRYLALLRQSSPIDVAHDLWSEFSRQAASQVVEALKRQEFVRFHRAGRHTLAGWPENLPAGAPGLAGFSGTSSSFPSIFVAEEGAR